MIVSLKAASEYMPYRSSPIPYDVVQYFYHTIAGRYPQSIDEVLAAQNFLHILVGLRILKKMGEV